MTDHMYHNERTKAHDIPIAHLDFKYIKECKDIKELEKIMKTLRSGEVGHYAELERCCEECIRNIDPENRVLRVSMPLGSLDQLDQPSREAIETGLQDWLEEMKSGDTEAGENLSHEALLERISRKRVTVLESEVEDKGLEYDDEVPAVRREIFFRGNSKSAIRARCDGDGNKPKRIVKPRDYSEWDKLEKEWDKELSDTITDVSSSCVQPNTVVEKGEKMDVSDTEMRSIQKLNLTELAKRVESLPEHTRRQMAVREKEKGNEAFHAGDYNEALVYYKRSLTILPMAAVHNNRALIYLHQKQWSAAAKDCARVLQEEPNNLKALFRSGRANYELHNLEQAEKDLERLTDQEPTNTKAQALLRSVRVAKTKRQASRLAGGRRMLITEEGDSESSDEDIPTNSQKKNSHSAQSFDSHNSQSLTDMQEPNVQQPALIDSRDSTEKLISEDRKGQTVSPAGCSKNIQNQIPTGQTRVRARKVYYPSNPGPYGREGMVIEELSDSDEPAQPQTSSPTEKPPTDGECDQVKTSPQVSHCKETKDTSLQNSDSSRNSQKPPEPELTEASSTSRLDKQERIRTFDEAKEQGKKLLGQGDLQKAMEAYTRSIELASGDPEQLALSYRNRALVALQMNENTKAIEDCNHAITIEPQNPVSYYRRALGLRALKNYEDSLRDLEKAHELRPCSENIRSELQKARFLVESNPRKERAASEFGTDAEDSLGFEVIDQPLEPSQDAGGDSYSVHYGCTTDTCDWQLVSEIVNESDLSKKADDEETELKETLDYLSESMDPTRITPCVFQNRWCSLRGLHADKLHKAVIKLLHETNPDRLNEVIGIKLDAPMLDEVIRALCWLCLTSDRSKDKAYDFAYKTLKNLSNLPRFDCALFLVEEPTIQATNLLFESLRKAENVSYNEAMLLQLKDRFVL
ncbi:Sperm associated antigen 1 [Clonorchis sinensis]|uniref:Sperm associated antigen 1 n=1 Tax=Clonorchis sinensis TaxID=79923 RepID=A0A8T1MPF4_CLOSI|nr:Sperm associated antigen 1 [Clonorchis sinensis]